MALGVAAYFLTAPRTPQLAEDRGQQIQAAAAGHVTTCDPAKLAKTGAPAQRDAELKRCQDDAKRESAEQQRRTEARATQAAEQGVWQTYYQARSAAIQTALAVLVLSATVWAAWAARSAAIYAKDAAEAAKDALEHDQTIDEVQVRPYVYITREFLGATDTKDSIVESLSFKIPRDVGDVAFSFKNFGQTPAKRVRVRARCFVGGYWNAPFASNFGSAVWVYIGDMPPGFERDLDGYTITNMASQYVAIKAAAKSAIIDGQIEYWDAAGTKFVTKFRRACTGLDVERGKFYVTPKGNEAT